MSKAGFWTLLLCCFLALPAQAERVHGIAMHGAPKYAAGFDHLGYVNPDAPKGGELKLSKTGTFDNLNHHIITGNNAEGLEYLNDKLMQRVWDEPFSLYGLVAESADISPDRSVVTFHLNKNARFHDGKPMTAEDVKFSYESYKKFGHPVRRRVYGLITDVTIKDPQTITFKFGKGYDRESVMILGLMPVLPKHYWETRDISKTTLTPPLGSGPYKIKTVEPGRKLVLERAKDYWAKDLPVNRGLYNFDTITYSYFRDDDIALQAFKSGEFNLRRESDVGKWETGYDFKALSEGRVKKEEIAHGRPEWLRAIVFNTRRPMFADRRVRQALGLMLNDSWLNKNLFFDKLKRIDSTFANSELAAKGAPAGEELRILQEYKKDLPPEVFGAAFTPAHGGTRDAQRQAIALLKEAGWIYKNQKLVNAAGEAFQFEMLLDNPNDEKIALSFARSLNRIGIETRVRTVDSGQFTGRLENFDYDVVFYKWINSLSPGNEQVNYWSTNAANNNGSRNYAGVKNPAIDALADSIARASDRKDLVARVHALDRALMYGYYMIPLFYLGKDLVAHDISLQRPSVTPVYGIVLESWWRQNPQ